MGQIGAVDGLTGIVHGQHRAVLVGAQAHGDAAACRGVLAGVVQQGGHQTLEAAGVAPYGNALVHGGLPGKAPFEGHRLEGERLAFHQAAEIDARRGVGGV